MQSNKQNKRRQKELALGKQRSNIAHRMAQWANQVIVIDDECSIATNNHQKNSTYRKERRSTY
jgi:hypothetical protein